MIFKIHVEGGGETNQLKTECRKDFSSFFEKAGLKELRKMPSVVACGSRNDAFDAFCTAVMIGKKQNQKHLPILLVDSEAAVSDLDKRWEHLKIRDNWDKPDAASDDQVFLMVECMESWILADRDCLNAYFRRGLQGKIIARERRN